MKAIAFLLVLFLPAFAGPKLHRADKMLLEDEPFSFDVLYGSREAYAAVRAAEKVEVYRLDPKRRAGSRKVRHHSIAKGPIELGGPQKEEIRELLLSKESFASRPACVPNYGVLMTVTSGNIRMDFAFCFECHMVKIICNDENDAVVISMTKKSFGPFLQAFRAVFPDDEELKKLQIK